jgi:hypothetical protein
MSSYSQADGHAFRRMLAGRAPAAEEPSILAEDLKIFATFWLGGLVFFGTFLA